MSVIENRVERELHICETCGYDWGFHVSFREVKGSHDVILICPECGQRYDINWKIRL
jgi:hypothetical protein